MRQYEAGHPRIALQSLCFSSSLVSDHFVRSPPGRGVLFGSLAAAWQIDVQADQHGKLRRLAVQSMLVQAFIHEMVQPPNAAKHVQFLSSTDSFVRFPPIAEFWQEKYGFIGDDGYIQLQAALTEHMHDREVPTSFEPQWAVLSIRCAEASVMVGSWLCLQINASMRDATMAVRGRLEGSAAASAF